ncbi:MAG: tRNA lysidine(34) synthetase TilS [Solirubrobacteraceae bacterium]
MTLVMLSGGQDSVCLLDVLLARGDDVEALHVNYGLRPEADADEACCRALCDRLAVTLHVHHAGEPPAVGNLQAWARDVRYAAALTLTDGDIATGHTATDQVETVLYRLAASPGRRALLGMHDRDGPIIRPLLHMTREDTAAHCRTRDLPWREDASNLDSRFARNRARAGLVPALRELHPAAEQNLLTTLEILRDEATVLDSLVHDFIAGRSTIPASELAHLLPAMRRLVFIELAGAPVGHRVDEVVELALKGGRSELHIGSGVRAYVRRGAIEVLRDDGEPRPSELGLGPPRAGFPVGPAA